MNSKTYYDIDRVSSSSLKWFKESPLFYRMMKDKEIEIEEKKWQDLGRQLHMLILEPEEFDKNFIYLEFETPKSPQQKQFCEDIIMGKDLIDAYKDNYVSAKKSEDKIKAEAEALKSQLSSYIEYLDKSRTYKSILNKTTWNYLNKAKDVLLSHKVASELLIDKVEDSLRDSYVSRNEFEIFWESPKHNLKCKSMLDRLIIDHDKKVVTLIDIKTTSSLKDFNKKIIEYGYHEQLAFYWMALYWYYKYEEEIDISLYQHRTFIIAISTGDAVECRVFQLFDRVLSAGFNEVNRIMNELSFHYSKNLWDHPRDYYEGDGIDKMYTEEV